MHQEVIETVMNELLEEEKLGNIKLDELAQKLEKMNSQISEFKDHMGKIKLSVPSINTLPLEVVLLKHIDSMQKEMEVLRAFVAKDRKRKRIKDVILEWLPWLLVIILCAIIFRIAIGGQFHGSLF